MRDEEQERKITLDHMIDEKFGEIFFLAKDEFDIKNKTSEEQELPTSKVFIKRSEAYILNHTGFNIKLKIKNFICVKVGLVS